MKRINIETLAKNQYIVTTSDNTEYLYSYDSVIAEKDSSGVIFLDKKYWNYSNTTGKYRNMFLNETMKETRQKINNGVYTLADLN